MQVAELTQDTFTQFLEGTIMESANGEISRVLTILELIDKGIFFLPGFMPTHKSMMDALSVTNVEELGWAGRVSEKLYGEREIALQSGGTSIRGYRLNNTSFIEWRFNAWLDNLGDNRKIVWSR